MIEKKEEVISNVISWKMEFFDFDDVLVDLILVDLEWYFGI